jgi:hypothetical protein
MCFEHTLAERNSAEKIGFGLVRKTGRKEEPRLLLLAGRGLRKFSSSDE